MATINSINRQLFCLSLLICWKISTSSEVPFSTLRHNHLEIGFFHHHMTHDLARIKCKHWSQSGKLVVISNQGIQDKLENHIRSSNLFDLSDWMNEDPLEQAYHVGAHDRDIEGRWVWLESGPVHLRGSGGFQNWGPSEPNNYALHPASPGEDCMSILMTDAFPDYGYSVGTWMDSSCELKKFYICQREASQTGSRRIRRNHFGDRHPISECNEDFTNALVELPLQTYPRCGVGGLGHVTGWIQTSANQEWFVKKGGNHVEMSIFPKRSLVSLVRHGALHVDKILIKSRSGTLFGSSHSFGGHRYSAEIQIVHEKSPRFGKVVFSFFIEERNTPPNKNWENVLNSVKKLRFQNDPKKIINPPTIESLLSDSYTRHSRLLTNLLGLQHKYVFATGTPCGKVTWVLLPRHIYMSSYQLSILRGISNQNRNEPVQQRHQGDACLLS